LVKRAAPWNVFSFTVARARGYEGKNRRGSESGPPHAPASPPINARFAESLGGAQAGV
jgi:hypothetical protein